ncbi:uncharacterized protein [Triticum aestivum]|uniref:uncharacterized protein isoform X2 n=1 Tax=Triticum aestivum TaxID=4565 RepID=UPI001D005883|nr:uncharacterized protein LOC123115527 isoform X2 [Triticum aestivum]
MVFAARWWRRRHHAGGPDRPGGCHGEPVQQALGREGEQERQAAGAAALAMPPEPPENAGGAAPSLGQFLEMEPCLTSLYPRCNRRRNKICMKEDSRTKLEENYGEKNNLLCHCIRGVTSMVKVQIKEVDKWDEVG